MADGAAGGTQRRNGAGGSGGNPLPTTQAQAARAYDHAVAYVHARAYVSLAVKGSGLLALLLSSVILLGGYVQSLGKKDFLCITAITVIQSVGIFNDWENSIEYFNDFFYTVVVKFGVFDVVGPKSFLILFLAYPFAIVILCVQMIYLLGPLACAAISSWRMAKLNHRSSWHGTDSTVNMMAALDIFYSLVIFQGIMFGALFTAVAIIDRRWVSYLVALEQLPDGKWGKEVMDKYLSDISAKCKQDPLSIRGMDLIKYAIELLDSESQMDYLYGARLLSAFVKKGEDVRSLLLPSRHKIQKLIESLRISSSIDESYLELMRSPSRCIDVMSSLDYEIEIAELAATIVADLAGHIDLVKYPESLLYISSLFQEETSQLIYWNSKQGQRRAMARRGQWSLLEELLELRLRPDQSTTERDERRQWSLMRDQKRLMIREERRQQNKEGDASYDLILKGLNILDRLAFSKDNCRLICSAPGLLPKITGPVYSDTLIQDVKMKKWAEVVTGCLKVQHKLIRTSGWTSRRLRHEISSNEQALKNMNSILDQGVVAGQELQLIAMEVLTELALDLSINLASETKKILIKRQLQVFHGEVAESGARAGRTLVSLSTNSQSNSALIMTAQQDIVGRLTELLDARNNITRRIIAAEIMDNLCKHCDMDKQHMKGTLLPKVLRNVSANQNTSDLESEEQEAFLSLTLAIYDKLNSANDFDDAIQNIIGRGAFADKLKSIINSNRQATAECLRIVKLCGRIAEATMQCDQYEQYAGHYRGNNGFESSLSEASETMSRVESCMLFLGTDFGLKKKTGRPLISNIRLERTL